MQNEMTRAEYNDLMDKINEGGKVNETTYEAMVAFAKAKKTKRPPEDAVVRKEDIVEVKAAATTQKGDKVKAKCSVTSNEDPKMVEGASCDKDARSNGMCPAHYSRLVYRAKPENAEKARQASANYAAKIREEKAELKAKADAKK